VARSGGAGAAPRIVGGAGTVVAGREGEVAAAGNGLCGAIAPGFTSVTLRAASMPTWRSERAPPSTTP